MKAVYIEEQGGLEVLQYGERPDPTFGQDEVLVRIHSAALNRLDLNVRSGENRVRVAFPRIPGLDMAGEIVEVGVEAMERCNVGDRVVIDPVIRCGYCDFCVLGQDERCLNTLSMGTGLDGGYAEMARVPARNVYKIPDWLSFDEAASIPLAFKTAWRMLVSRAEIQFGEDVLVHAAGSGVGSAAIQIARLFGCRTFVTAGSDWKLEKAQEEWGADFGINYNETDFAEMVLALTEGEGVDVIIDNVGIDTWPGSFNSLRRLGRYVVCGVTSGYRGEIHLGQVFTRGLSIMGIGGWRNAEFATIMKLVEQKKLKGVVFQSFPLSDVQDAHALMESREFYGKIILNP
ncbi:MAG: zinc-binding dehydrogenase [SAR202 cluster bacterium]|nr:zinc-binding dehydrogenase [SAR202 cluster bacterium]|tara:strand:+ start:16361 stop:17395 length:1035 start_codon:yes stop_codon:yes gene_type:complete